jgi:putative flippase GtrA
MTSTKIPFFNKTTIRFFLVGIIGAIFEIVLFSGSVRVGLGILYSNFIAFNCAFALCFFLHYYYTYQRPYEGIRRIFSGFVQYVALMYVQLIIGSILLWFLIEKLYWMAEIAKIIQIGLVIPLSYIIQKLIIFRWRREV